ncbi:MAG: 50S ribosomal protein L25/general stress protein Ctc [Gammaproteobacteria bacterium]|nr:50S ribosomal protein L25/general stress protein Ctc [Gammaproteobacteria bacterium]MDH3972268.1 50S ribosomal protein L25/general stress protein Ctc [Gammaproteobacteria bacterium]
MNIFELEAESRSDMGKGASRRLRRDGKVPAIMYGAEVDPQSITLVHSEIIKRLEHEAFYSHILTVNLDGKSTKAVLRDMQRHPAKPIIMHMDFQRVDENKAIHVNVPLHFVGADVAPGVKASGMVSHELIGVDLAVLPAHLPEFIEVDISAMNIGDALHLSDLKLPETGVLVELGRGEGHDLPVVSIHAPRTVSDEEEQAAAPEEGGEAATDEG